jgi:DNA repair exonuclease SbcCD ATPase subunit
MRSQKIHYVRAQNILCFGDAGFELHFTDYGNVVAVRGLNLDNPHAADDPASSSNATGKSSLQEILSIGFYGRMVKAPTKNKGGHIINVLADRGEVEIQWDDYRLVRAFKREKNGSVKGTLKLWKSADKIWDKATALDRGKDDAEDEILRIVGLSHHAFCNVVIFDDSNTYSFLEANNEVKREIVENLLDLDQYREYHQNAKDRVKGLKEEMALLSREYAALKDEAAAADRRIATATQQEATWRLGKAAAQEAVLKRAAAKQAALAATAAGEQLDRWQAAQDGIAALNDEIVDLDAKREKLDAVLATARGKVDGVRAERQAIKEGMSEQTIAMQSEKADLERALALIAKLEGLKEGAECPLCHGSVSRHNHGHVLEQSRCDADRHRQAITAGAKVLEAEREKYDKKTATLALMEEKIRDGDAKVAALDAKVRKNRAEISALAALPKPENNAQEQVLEAEIVELRRQAKALGDEAAGDSPYKEILAQAGADKAAREAERDAKAGELEGVEAELPYFQFWVEAFGDNGIRKFVIESIIPALNDRIAYWLQILIDGRIELTFDNRLDPTVTRNGNPAHYPSMSNGEKRRLNLAVTQAFAYVMTLNSGSCPSVVFLDEITGGAIDRAGVIGVYNMIFELAKERQVFVTTHNETLMALLHGCENITLKKQNDITVLAA